MKYRQYPEVNISKSGLLNIRFIGLLLIVLTAFVWKNPEEKACQKLKCSFTGDKAIIGLPRTLQKLPEPEVKQSGIAGARISNQSEEGKPDQGAGKGDSVKASEDTSQVADSMEAFRVIEETPEFPGGDTALRSYLAKHIQYPEEAEKSGISGKVYVQFVVDKDGSITNVKVIKGIGAGCDEEARRVVRSMPEWDPGRQKGEPVRVRLIVPVNFLLN